MRSTLKILAKDQRKYIRQTLIQMANITYAVLNRKFELCNEINNVIIYFAKLQTKVAKKN
jgi:hypothetical protein